MAEKPKPCIECKWFKPNPDSTLTGHCYYHPPVVVVRHPYVITARPETTHDKFCHAHEPK